MTERWLYPTTPIPSFRARTDRPLDYIEVAAVDGQHTCSAPRCDAQSIIVTRARGTGDWKGHRRYSCADHLHPGILLWLLGSALPAPTAGWVADRLADLYPVAE